MFCIERCANYVRVSIIFQRGFFLRNIIIFDHETFVLYLLITRSFIKIQSKFQTFYFLLRVHLYKYYNLQSYY